MNCTIHSLQYCMSIPTCIYSALFAHALCDPANPRPQAHRFCIELDLFSVSGIILSNRKLLNSTATFVGVALHFVNSVSRVKN